MTRNKSIDSLKTIDAGTGGRHLGASVGSSASVHNVLAFKKGTADASGVIHSINITVATGRLYQIIAFVQANYNNYDDSYIIQIFRKHAGDADILIAHERASGWDAMYNSASNICVIDQAEHTGTYTYELRLPKWSGGVILKRHNFTVIDLGPAPSTP